MKRAATVISMLSLSLIAACSGGAQVGFNQEFASLVTEADRLTTRLEPLSETPALPGSGGATYQGVVILADDFNSSDTGVVGTANLTANFNAPASISGTGTGFYQAGINASGNPTGTGTPTPGSLNFSANNIGTAFNLGVDGTVTIDGTSRTINGTAPAAFFGPNAEMFSALGTDLPTTTAYNVDIAIIAD